MKKLFSLIRFRIALKRWQKSLRNDYDVNDLGI